MLRVFDVERPARIVRCDPLATSIAE